MNIPTGQQKRKKNPMTIEYKSINQSIIVILTKKFIDLHTHTHTHNTQTNKQKIFRASSTIIEFVTEMKKNHPMTNIQCFYWMIFFSLFFFDWETWEIFFIFALPSTIIIILYNVYRASPTPRYTMRINGFHFFLV